MTFKLSVNDKLSKITETLEKTLESSGFLTFNGKILENLEDTTFSKQMIGDKATVLFNKGEGGFGPPMKWVRFK